MARYRPARGIEKQEQQLIAKAVDLAERQLEEGTASAQVITHYLKLGTTREQLEKEKLRKENELLKSDKYKDVVIAKYKEKYEEVRDKLSRGFGISKDEQEKINKWMETHECKYRRSKLSEISEYRFDIIPGIGYNGYVMCNCGDEFCFCEE